MRSFIIISLLSVFVFCGINAEEPVNTTSAAETTTKAATTTTVEVITNSKSETPAGVVPTTTHSSTHGSTEAGSIVAEKNDMESSDNSTYINNSSPGLYGHVLLSLFAVSVALKMF